MYLELLKVPMKGWVVTEVTNVDPVGDRGGESESETIPGGMV